MRSIFFIIFFSILTGSVLYLGLRLIRPLRVRFGWKILFWMMLFSMMFLPLTYRNLTRKGVLTDVCPFAPELIFLIFGYISLLLVLVAARDGLWALLAGAKWVGRRFTSNRRADEDRPADRRPDDPERRTFLINAMNAGIMGGAAVLTGRGLYNVRTGPDIARVRVALPNLPDEFHGFRIAQITDLHIGQIVRAPVVRRVVDMVMAEQPDAIVITGDLVDGPFTSNLQDMGMLNKLSAPHGVYAVTGNHEYYAGLDLWLETVRGFGQTVLMNDHRVIEKNGARLLMAGVNDPHRVDWTDAVHRVNMTEALAGAPPCDVKILLAHRPQSVFEASRAGIDLQLSGHTHGGQYVPGNLLVRLREPYVSGLHFHDQTWIYVSRGAGQWGPPIRLGAPAEVPIITLTRTRTRPSTA